MKVLKFILLFIIFYFTIVMFNGMVEFAKKISFGNQVIEIGFYVLIGVLVTVYLIIPLVKYMKYPSTNLIRKMNEDDIHATKKLYRYYVSNKMIEPIKNADLISMRNSVREHLSSRISKFDREIRSIAFKITSTVIISPNSFIDGMAIILGNCNMIYKLSKILGVRYNVKELAKIYFNIFAVASISGLLEEYDEVLEDFLLELLEKVSAATGKEIPFASLFIGALSPILQASLNFAFMTYNGLRFKYTMKNLINDEKNSDSTINSIARKESRKARVGYVKEISEKVKGRFKKNKNESNPFFQTEG